ncbi:BadF/BadG/BcrA/BcrD ATPase family protein [Bacillus sp. AFS041924]|uniref:BadF/BadG/BcrA/BcrD ATPase family protein n=1 Tax=Bacillus sp. AFS041924 TaxID=2033503 RepID=UPI000BFD9E60|nr:BadF/BadG/BcrA/BcrD ATPase family protein [Bacillus sp. AFS041924]PGS49846.1 ATPase [Bacillus sp. AFS041924]
MKYIISLDGGGTKSEAVAYNLEGEIISQGFSGFSNLLVNEKDGINHMIEAIENCLSPLSKENCLFLFLGIAGIGGVRDRGPLEKALNDAFHIPFKIVNDAQIAHAALLNGQSGVLTIAGTGSICIGVHKERTVTAGGWGHLLGDEGSGYWICMEIFKKITQQFDEGIPLSYLSLKMLERLQLKEADGLKKYIYHNTKAEIASHVPFIVELANMGDLMALTVLERAGQLLGKTTIQAIKKLDLKEEPRVAIKGSVLQRIPVVQKTFIQTIREHYPIVEFYTEDVSSTYGGYLLAKNEVN